MQNITNPLVIAILEQTQQDGHLSRRHYSQIISLMLRSEITRSDRSRLNQILDKLQLGQLSMTS